MLYTSTVSFPNLGIGEFDISNIAFTIPGINKTAINNINAINNFLVFVILISLLFLSFVNKF